MAENGEEKGSGAWAKVPTWDGAPTTWRAFQREMVGLLAGPGEHQEVSTT